MGPGERETQEARVRRRATRIGGHGAVGEGGRIDCLGAGVGRAGIDARSGGQRAPLGTARAGPSDDEHAAHAHEQA